MRIRILCWTVALTTLFFSASAAGGESKAHIGVISTAEDTVGSQLVYKIKEGLRSSKGMTLASPDESVVQLRVITLDPDDNTGRRTIYSVVWTVPQFTNKSAKLYWTSSVGICGANRISSCAESLIAETDKVVSEVQDVARNILKELNKK